MANYPGIAKVKVTPSGVVKVVIGRFRSQYTKAGIWDLTDGEDSFDVVFDSPIQDGLANYIVQTSIFNSADNPDLSPFYTIKITAKGANGFTAKLSAPVLGSNYKLHWSLAEVTEESTS